MEEITYIIITATTKMFGSQATKTRGFRYYPKKRITIPQIPMTYHAGVFKTIPEK